jgi:general secretion pathway protein K
MMLLTGKGSGERGFILVAVLWIMAAISALTLVYSAYVSTTAVAMGDSTTRVQDQALLTGAIELACYQFLSGSDKAPGSGNFNGRIGSARISIAYVSEAARIDLNLAPKEMLTGLFLGLGETQSRAEDFASRIVGWRTAAPAAQGPNDNAEDALYRASGLDYLPRHGAFSHVDELRLVYGLPKHLVDRMLPSVTVFNGRPAISIVEAPPQVIAALPHMTAERLQTILTARSEGMAPLDLLALAGESPNLVTTDRSSSTRIAIGIEYVGGRRISSEVVVLLPNDGTEPYRLLSRQDNIATKLGSAPQQKDPT